MSIPRIMYERASVMLSEADIASTCGEVEIAFNLAVKAKRVSSLLGCIVMANQVFADVDLFMADYLDHMAVKSLYKYDSMLG